jgi:ribA/ribD-fused uncharacterized protein
MTISSFRGKYIFLSNFYACTIKIHGLTFKSSEAAFQASKCESTESMTRFEMLNSVDSKRLGRRIKLRSDWEDIKLDIMEEIIRKKFDTTELANRLIGTGDEEIIEENTWKDYYWGVCNGVGKNMLGKILMKTRLDLIK